MPRGGTRGKKFGHKGNHRQFTNAEEIQRQQEQIRREKEAESSDEEDAERPGISRPEPTIKNESSSESESESSEDENAPKKGVQHLIQVDNPNRVKVKTKKITQLTLDDKPQLNRKEREAVDAERKRQAYQKLHEAGKTEEAQKDLARLAVIRKQREDAAKKRDDDKKAKEAAAKK